jgi:hypothetical protein
MPATKRDDRIAIVLGVAAASLKAAALLALAWWLMR